MTSFAFILGCVPLWIASGSGAAARRILGTVVITGMLAATLIAVFLIPLLFVLFERLALDSARKRTIPCGPNWPRGERIMSGYSMLRNTCLSVTLAASTVLGVGCTVGPNYKRPGDSPGHVPRRANRQKQRAGPQAHRSATSPWATSSKTRRCGS